jgi:hypothetical protein
MKRILMMVMLAALVSASSAFATTVLTNYSAPAPSGAQVGPYYVSTTSAAGPITIGQTPFSVSTNVSLIAAGGAGGYNVSSKHLSGDKSYLSSSVSASINENGLIAKGTAMTTLVLGTGADLYTGSGGY